MALSVSSSRRTRIDQPSPTRISPLGVPMPTVNTRTPRSAAMRGLDGVRPGDRLAVGQENDRGRLVRAGRGDGGWLRRRRLLGPAGHAPLAARIGSAQVE